MLRLPKTAVLGIWGTTQRQAVLCFTTTHHLRCHVRQLRRRMLESRRMQPATVDTEAGQEAAPGAREPFPRVGPPSPPHPLPACRSPPALHTAQCFREVSGGLRRPFSVRSPLLPRLPEAARPGPGVWTRRAQPFQGSPPSREQLTGTLFRGSGGPASVKRP